jgi:hypothetical protein
MVGVDCVAICLFVRDRRDVVIVCGESGRFIVCFMRLLSREVRDYGDKAGQLL